MRIREVGQRLGVSVEWLRRLEKRGSIPRATRDLSGHRRFTEDDLDRLRKAIFSPTGDIRRVAIRRARTSERGL